MSFGARVGITKLLNQVVKTKTSFLIGPEIANDNQNTLEL
jgi:hypothetical protein